MRFFNFGAVVSGQDLQAGSALAPVTDLLQRNDTAPFCIANAHPRPPGCDPRAEGFVDRGYALLKNASALVRQAVATVALSRRQTARTL